MCKRSLLVVFLIFVLLLSFGFAENSVSNNVVKKSAEVEIVLNKYFGGEELTISEKQMIAPFIEINHNHLTRNLRSKEVVLSEDFSGGVLPTGWTVLEGSLSNVDWDFSALDATCDCSSYGDYAQDTLISPTIDCSSYLGLRLNFYQDYDAYSYGDVTTQVLISNDGGATWIVLLDYTGIDHLAENVGPVDISTYADGEANVKIAFAYESDFGYHWTIDDIVIDTPPTEPIMVLSTYSIDFGNVGAEVGKETVSEKVYVSNNGGGTLNITGFTLSSADLSVDSTSLTVEPGVTDSFVVSFASSTAGVFNGKVTIASNDAVSTDTIAVTATVIPAGYVVESFEDDFPPQGWDRVGYTSSYLDGWYENTSSSYVYDGSKSVKAKGQNSWLFTPKLTISTGDFITFYYRSESSSYPAGLKLRISTGSDQMDTTGYTAVLWEDDNVDETEYQKVTYTFDATYDGQDVYLAFQRNWATSNYYYTYVDYVTHPPIYYPEVSSILISEIVVTPTAGEFVEIYNSNIYEVDLSNYYLTDATYASGGAYYYNIVTGSNYGGGSSADFHARFPDGATIAAEAYQTISMAGSEDFLAEYGVDPDYELYEDGASADAIPDMREAVAGSINNQGGLTNGDEVVILYYWDGESDLVMDSDYLLWDDGAEVPNEAVDKTGVTIDGPDADTDVSAYLDDTPIASQDFGVSPGYGFSLHRIDYTEGLEAQADGNGITGSDETSENTSATFAISLPTPGADAQLDIYEPNDILSAATAITVPDTIVGPEINPDGDVDWFSFAADSGSYLILDLFIDGFSSLDGEIALFYSDSVKLESADSYGSGSDEEIEYFVDSTGTYYVAVAHYSDLKDDRAYTGAYALGVSVETEYDPCADYPDLNEPNNDVANATVVYADDSLAAALCPTEDLDYYSITISDDGLLYAETHPGAAGDYGTDTYMYLLGSDGTTVLDEDDDAGDGFTSYVEAEVTAGTYYVLVEVSSYAAGDVFDYGVSFGLYIPPEVYPPANFTAYPGDSKVYLDWDRPVPGKGGNYSRFSTPIERDRMSLNMNYEPKKSKDITGSAINVVGGYIPGETQDLQFAINIVSPDYEWSDSVSMTFPAGFTVNSASDIDGEVYNGTDGSLVEWGDNDNSSGGIVTGTTLFTVNVTVDAGVTGEQTINYHISGDEYGAVPNFVDGSLLINEGGGCEDDEYEDNDDYLNPAAMIPGLYEDLMLCYMDADWYSVMVPAYGSITVTTEDTVGLFDLLLFNLEIDASYAIDYMIDSTEMIVSYVSILDHESEFLVAVRDYDWNFGSMAQGPYDMNIVVEEAEVYTYDIYSVDKTLIGSTTETEYLVTELTNGVEYCFYGKTVNEAEIESPPSDTACATPEPALLCPPVGLTAVPGDTSVYLSWSEPEPPMPPCWDFEIDALPFDHIWSNIGATDDFDVDLSDGADIAYKLTLDIQTTLDITLCDAVTDYDTKLQIFYDCETPSEFYDDDGDYDCPEAIVSTNPSELIGIVLDPGTYLIVVDGFSGYEGNYGIHVSESVAEKYVFDAEAARQYELDKLSSMGLSEDLMLLDKQENPCGTLLGYKVYNSAGDSLTYSTVTNALITGLTNDVEYCFYVTADYEEGESLPSDTVCATPEELVPLPPVNLTATPFDEEVRLDWEEPGTAPLIYFECFETCDGPVGWGMIIENVVDNGTGGWLRVDDGTTYGCGTGMNNCGDDTEGHCVFAAWSAEGSAVTSRLISPLIDLTSETAANLTFESAYNYPGDADSPNEVEVSIDGGTTWTTVYTEDPTVIGTWHMVQVDLSTYAGSQINLGFKYISTAGNAEGWFIDDIAVRGALGRTFAYNFRYNTIVESNKDKVASNILLTSGNKEISGSNIVSETGEYFPDATDDLWFTINQSSSDVEFIDGFSMTFPSGVVVNFASATDGGTPWNGETGDGATITWGDMSGGSGWGTIVGSEDFSVNLSTAGFSGPMVIDYTLVGDGYGTAPHTIDGQLTLYEHTFIPGELLGYNVFVNDVQHNTEIVRGLKYMVTDLTNEVMYTLGVSAEYYPGVHSDTIEVEAAPIYMFGEITGVVYNPNDVPIENAVVSCMGLTDTTGTDGVYLLENLIPGPNVVKATADGFDKMAIEVEIIAQADPVVVDFHMIPALGRPGGLFTAEGDSRVDLQWFSPGAVGDELVEGFEAAVFPPEGWTQIITHPTTTWQQYTDEYAYEGIYSAGTWWDYGHQDEWLITPELTIGYRTTLTFWSYAHEGSPNDDHYYVKVSTDGGSNWIPVFDLSTLPPMGELEFNEWEYPYTVDLSDFAGEDVMIAWHAEDPPDNDGLWFIWMIDAIYIGSEKGEIFYFNTGLCGITPPGVLAKKDAKHVPTDVESNYTQTIIHTPLNKLIASKEDTLLGYNVYRIGEIEDTLLTPTMIADTFYTDLFVMNYVEYSYYVKAIWDTDDWGDVESKPSNIASATPWKLGDPNFDDNINVADIVLLVNFILMIDEPTADQFRAADVNFDDNLNILDIIILIDIMLGRSTAKEVNDPGITADLILPDIAPIHEKTGKVDLGIDFDGTAYGLQFTVRYNPDLMTIGNPVINANEKLSIVKNQVEKGEMIVLAYSMNGEKINFNVENLFTIPVEFVSKGYRGKASIEIDDVILAGPSGAEILMDKNSGSVTLAVVPVKYALHQNYPNPFNPTTTINYDLPKNAHVEIVIYNMLGQNIRKLVNDDKPFGYHSVVWDGMTDAGESVSSGLYIYRIISGDFHKVKKMVLLK